MTSSTDEQRYLELLEVGPNASGLGTMRWALRYEQEHPQAALRLRQAHAQAKREAERVQLYESTAVAHGASVEDTRRDALAYVRAEREERVSEAVSEAHRLAAQRTRQTF